MSKTNLEQQIMSALTDDAATAADLAELVATTEVTISEAEGRARAAAECALDPMTTVDTRAARAASDDAAIEAGRLRTLLPRLESRYREVVHATARARWLADFALLEHARNNHATALREVPKLLSQLVLLLARSADLDQRLSQLHQSRPSGCKGQLLSAELIARNLTEFSRDQPQFARDLRLPDWSGPSRLIWPPREIPASVLLSESISQAGDRQRHSGDWHASLKADTERRRLEEAKRIEAEEQHTAQQKREYEQSLR
jgi:hypothetical protein